MAFDLKPLMIFLKLQAMKIAPGLVITKDTITFRLVRCDAEPGIYSGICPVCLCGK